MILPASPSVLTCWSFYFRQFLSVTNIIYAGCCMVRHFENAESVWIFEISGDVAHVACLKAGPLGGAAALKVASCGCCI